MNQSQKPTYNTLQNVGYMLGLSPRHYPGIPYLCLAVALVTAGTSIAQLLIVPSVLRQVEVHAPLASLVTVILLFGAVLFVLYGLKAYLKEVVSTSRGNLRLLMVTKISDKMARTSFPNPLDAEFENRVERSLVSCHSPASPTEAVWATLTDILTNLIGFGVYLALLSGLHPLLLVVVVVTTVAGYLFSRRVNRWVYDHRTVLKYGAIVLVVIAVVVAGFMALF